MPSLPNPIKIATKGAEIGFQVGSFVAGQAFQRVQSLMGGDSDNGGSTYSPVQPPKREDQPAQRSPQPAKLEAVKTPGETSTGSKPTTSATTATGPGGTNRMAPKAPAKKPAARTATTAKSATPKKGSTAKAAATAKPAPKPAATAAKGETASTVKASSRTGARSAGGRISNPKAAAKARKRAAAAAAKSDGGDAA